ncbi:MAG: class I SAM-dependent methyltransferase [Bacteroidetes bacterium]|nr:MAG: class I SAM-dependent methyltransferase [Bacteroidota bacterium]
MSLDRNKVLQVFNHSADRYLEKFGNLSAFSSILDQLLKQAPQNARILDLACGPGNLARYLLDQRRDLQLLGIDFAPEMIELAKKNVPEAAFECRNVLEYEMTTSEWSVILISFLLPYLKPEEAIELLDKVQRQLSQKGLLFISTMIHEQSAWIEQVSSENPDRKLNSYYYSKAELLDILKQSGFSLLEELQVDNPEISWPKDIYLLLEKV